MNARFRILLPAAMVISASLAWADQDVDIAPDVVYGHKHGMALTFDVYKPSDANGAGVLFVVSGGWYSRWMPPSTALPLVQPFLDNGFTVFAVRHGSSPKYVVPEILEDVRRAVRFIRLKAEQFGVDGARLGVTGLSAGGHLSLLLGTASDEGDPEARDVVLRASDRVAAVVAYCPPTDIRPWVNEESEYWKNYPALQFDPGQAGDCSPILHVSQDDPPTLLIHGDQDKLVPLEHSQSIKAEFKKNGVDCALLVIEGAGHGFRGDDMRRAAEASVTWFKSHLVTSSSHGGSGQTATEQAPAR